MGSAEHATFLYVIKSDYVMSFLQKLHFTHKIWGPRSMPPWLFRSYFREMGPSPQRGAYVCISSKVISLRHLYEIFILPLKTGSAEHASVALSLTSEGPRDPRTQGKSLGPWDRGSVGPWVSETQDQGLRDPGTHGPRAPGTQGPRDPRTHVRQGFGSLGPWGRGSLASFVFRHSFEYNITRLTEHGRRGMLRPGFCVFCVPS